MGIKNRISKIVKLTVFMLLAVVISASFMQITFAKKVIKSVPSHAENYKMPRYITYEELYIANEEELICKLKKVDDAKLIENFVKFENITKDEIPCISLPKVKIRDLNPLVQGKRIK